MRPAIETGKCEPEDVREITIECDGLSASLGYLEKALARLEHRLCTVLLAPIHVDREEEIVERKTEMGARLYAMRNMVDSLGMQVSTLTDRLGV